MSPSRRTARQIGATRLRFARSRRPKRGRRRGASNRRSDPRPKRFRAARITIAAAGWLIILTTFAIACAGRFPPDGRGQVSFACHLASSFLPAVTAAALAIAAIALLRRRWTQAAIALAAGGIALSAVPAAPRQRSADVIAPNETLVRVLHWNVRHNNRDPEPLIALLDEHQPDIVFLLETFGALHLALKRDERITQRYPHRVVPKNVGKGMRAILSTYPLRGGEGWEPPDRAEGPTYAIAEIAGVYVGTAAFHPLSPRTPENAARGRRDLQHVSETLSQRFGEHTPLIAGADLNGSPTSARARLLHHSTGLRPSKPLLSFAGTWPQSLASPLRVAIDDVWTRGPIRMLRWRTITGPGSDHAAVLVELALQREE
jgi:endonuclease/exonuclease/phosphatase (EEP) superfamily protein YafD